MRWRMEAPNDAYAEIWKSGGVNASNAECVQPKLHLKNKVALQKYEVFLICWGVSLSNYSISCQCRCQLYRLAAQRPRLEKTFFVGNVKWWRDICLLHQKIVILLWKKRFCERRHLAQTFIALSLPAKLSLRFHTIIAIYLTIHPYEVTLFVHLLFVLCTVCWRANAGSLRQKSSCHLRVEQSCRHHPTLCARSG